MELIDGSNFLIVGSGPTALDRGWSPTGWSKVLFLNHSYFFFGGIERDNSILVTSDSERIREMKLFLDGKDPTWISSTNANLPSSDLGKDRRFHFVAPRTTRQAEGWAIDYSQRVSRDLNYGTFIGHSVFFTAVQLALASENCSEIKYVGIDWSMHEGRYIDDAIQSHWKGFNFAEHAAEHLNSLRIECERRAVDFSELRQSSGAY
jgi:hypothetical protein